MIFKAHTGRRASALRPVCFVGLASAALAAAAEYENDSYDDKPDIAVIKKVAKTVVHNKPPKECVRALRSRY